MEQRKEICGGITLYNADCMELLREMPDNAYDLAIVDPPYGDGCADGGGNFEKRFGALFDKYKRPVEQIRTAVRSLQENLPTCATYPADSQNIENPPPENSDGNVGKAIIGWDVAPEPEYFKELFRVSRNQIIWGANYFPNMPPTRCFIVWKKHIPENFSMAMCEYAWTSFNANAKVWIGGSQGNAKDKRFHPTQKPVALYAWLLNNYAKPGDKILDTHLGSGSIGIACHDLGFELTGIELDQDYFEKAVERLRQHQRQLTMF